MLRHAGYSTPAAYFNSAGMPSKTSHILPPWCIEHDHKVCTSGCETHDCIFPKFA